MDDPIDMIRKLNEECIEISEEFIQQIINDCKYTPVNLPGLKNPEILKSLKKSLQVDTDRTHLKNLIVLGLMKGNSLQKIRASITEKGRKHMDAALAHYPYIVESIRKARTRNVVTLSGLRRYFPIMVAKCLSLVELPRPVSLDRINKFLSIEDFPPICRDISIASLIPTKPTKKKNTDQKEYYYTKTDINILLSLILNYSLLESELYVSKEPKNMKSGKQKKSEMTKFVASVWKSEIYSESDRENLWHKLFKDIDLEKMNLGSEHIVDFCENY